LTGEPLNKSGFDSKPVQLHGAEHVKNQGLGPIYSAMKVWVVIESALARYVLRVESLGDFSLCAPVSALPFLIHIQNTSCSTI
jgi:hypothetical protein